MACKVSAVDLPRTNQHWWLLTFGSTIYIKRLLISLSQTIVVQLDRSSCISSTLLCSYRTVRENFREMIEIQRKIIPTAPAGFHSSVGTSSRPLERPFFTSFTAVSTSPSVMSSTSLFRRGSHVGFFYLWNTSVDSVSQNNLSQSLRISNTNIEWEHQV